MSVEALAILSRTDCYRLHGPAYVVILTLAAPIVGVAMCMIGILAGQVFKSLVIDHFGLFGTGRRQIDAKRLWALVFIIAALALVAKG